MFSRLGAHKKVLRQQGLTISSLSLGLYIGRILSEITKFGIAGAVILTLLVCFLAVILLRRFELPRSSPMLLLLVYVVYPEPNVKIAVSVGLLAIFTMVQFCRIGRSEEYKFAGLGNWGGYALVGISFLGLYLLTLSGDILPADSGEFQMVAAKLGVAHPPGFPLYTVMSHLFSRLPIGDTQAFRVNLLSAFTSTLTLMLLFGSVRKLTGSTLAGVIAAFTLGTATTFWAQATTANIRSLTCLFASSAIFVVVHLRDASRSATTNQSVVASEVNQRTDRANHTFSNRLFALSLLLSLGVLHHPSLLFISLILVIYVVSLYPGLLKPSRSWLIILLGILIALIPLVYLPIRGASGALNAPDDLTSLAGFIRHILALGFRGDFLQFTSASDLLDRLKVMVNVITFQFNPVLIIGMAFGLVMMFRKDKKLTFTLAGAFSLHLIVTAFYKAPQTVEYMLPGYILPVIFLGYAASELIRVTKLPNKKIGEGRAIFPAIAISITLIAIGWQTEPRLQSFISISNDRSSRSYAQNLLAEAPENCVILADWHWVTPLWYLQEVEGVRPDVFVEYVSPADEPYAQTWANQISNLLDEGKTVIATHFDEVTYASLPIPRPIDEAFLFNQSPLKETPANYSSLTGNLGDVVELVGYDLSSADTKQSQEVRFLLAWRAIQEPLSETTLFVHLVGEDGGLYAQHDVKIFPQPGTVKLTEFRLTPRPGTWPGRFDLMVGAYGSKPYLDQAGQSRSFVTSIDVTSSSWPAPSRNPVHRQMIDEKQSKALIGYDVDGTVPGHKQLYLHWKIGRGYVTDVIEVAGSTYALPAWYGPWGIPIRNSELDLQKTQHYVPLGQGIVWTGSSYSSTEKVVSGQQLLIDQRFISTQPVYRDLVVSVRLVGYENDNRRWAWWDLSDGIPALGAIPTLKWITGSRIRDTHWLAVSEGATPGQQVEPLVRLYDAFTGRPLPILDPYISQNTPWIPLGRRDLVAE